MLLVTQGTVGPIGVVYSVQVTQPRTLSGLATSSVTAGLKGKPSWKEDFLFQ